MALNRPKIAAIKLAFGPRKGIVAYESNNY